MLKVISKLKRQFCNLFMVALRPDLLKLTIIVWIWLYLRIANELYLKRLIVGGFDGVYEFSKDFRNEGMDRFHNPEFTQMELYVAYKDYDWMMNLVEEMVEKMAMDIHGTTSKLKSAKISSTLEDHGNDSLCLRLLSISPK